MHIMTWGYKENSIQGQINVLSCPLLLQPSVTKVTINNSKDKGHQLTDAAASDTWHSWVPARYIKGTTTQTGRQELDKKSRRQLKMTKRKEKTPRKRPLQPRNTATWPRNAARQSQKDSGVLDPSPPELYHPAIKYCPTGTRCPSSFT